MVKLHFPQEVEQSAKALLGFIGEADNQCCPEDKRRDTRAHFSNCPAHPVYIRRAAHCAQHFGIGVLQRDIEVGQQLTGAGHQVDEAPGDKTREGVEQPHPRHPGNGWQQRFKQVRKPILNAQILGVICYILRNQVNFLDAGFLQCERVGQDIFLLSADQGTFDPGDGAKSTGAPAAVCDFQVAAAPLDGVARQA